MLTTRIREARRLFFTLNSWNMFKEHMLEMGFEFNDLGCNKDVFIHPKERFVVKLIHGYDGSPKKRHHGLKKYFVPIHKHGSRLLKKTCSYTSRVSTQKYTFALQVKVAKAKDMKAYRFFEREQKRLGINWPDCKDQNVGHLKGKPVIIDF